MIHIKNARYVIKNADTVLENLGTTEELIAQVDAWWEERSARGWA